MIQDKIFLDEKDPTGLSYNTPFTVYGSYQGRLWSKTPSGSIQYYSQNSDLSAYATTGSNQFNGSQTITGSLTVTGGISGSNAESASYALNADKIDNLDSTQLVLTSSFNSYTSSASSSVGSLSSSVATTTSGLGGRITTIEGNYATTGSNIFLGSQVITGSICSNGNIVTTGQIVAQTINVQQVTSSIVYSCGSNIFGTDINNTQQFTGSMFITGSNIRANVGNTCFQGSVTACNMFLQVPSSAAVVDILRLNNPAVASSGTRLKFENGYGDLAAIRVIHMDNGSLADDGQIEFQTAQNAVLGTRMTIFNTGISCFACQICAPNIISSGTICSIGNTCFGGMTLVNSCLGIGTTTPATKLNIRSDAADDGILLEKSDGTDIARLFYDGTSTNARLDMFCGGSTKVQIHTNGTSHFSGGNVGINTTSPSAKLDVSYISGGEIGVRLVGGGGACAGNMFRSYIGDYSDNSPINLFWANHGNPARTNTLVRIHTNETASGGYPFRITAQGSLCSPTYEALSINYQGKVGIGTIVGTAALGIGGSGAQTTANLTDGGSRIGIIESIPVGGEGGNGGALVLGSDTWGNGSGRGQIALKALLINGSGCGTSDLAFSLRNDPSCSNLTERMRITVGGCVGIGTSNPSERLDVLGPNGSVATIRWRNEGGRKSGYLYSDSAGVAIYDTVLNDAGIYLAQNSQIDFRVGGAQRMKIDCSGLILACGRTSSIMASSGNIQEWVGLTGSIANNTGWSLFSIANQYDNLSMDMYVFTDVGSFQSSKHEAVISYTQFANSGIGYSSAFCIFKTGTLYNETMTICNLSGANINSQRIAIRVWGYGVGQNGTGGSNLLNTSCLTRIA